MQPILARPELAPYTIEAIRSDEGLNAHEANWNRLSEAAESTNVFSTFAWFHAWNRYFSSGHGERRHPEVLVVKERDAVAGVSPLIYRKASGLGLAVRKLEFLEIGSDYNDLVVGSDPAVLSTAVVQYLLESKSRWDIVDLLNLRATDEERTAIDKALSRSGLLYRILPWGRCPYLPIDAPWCDMIKKLSYSSRRTFRNQQHRLERLQAQGLRVRIIDQPGPAELEILIELERQKRTRGEPAAPFFAKYESVFHALFETLGTGGWLFLAIMEMGDKPIACQLGFRCGKKLWDYFTAYDASFSHLSPGTMLIPAIIDHGFAQGCTEYDFLRGDEPYKMRWSTGCHDTFRLLIWKRGWWSRARAFAYLDLKEQVYRLIPRAVGWRNGAR